MMKYLLAGLMITQWVVAKEPSDYLKQAKQVSQHVWIGPQPQPADYAKFAGDDIVVVINTRTEEEMQDLDFDTAALADKHGMHHNLIEVGAGHPYTPAKLAEFAALMKQHEGQKMVLHCRSGHRASQLYAAWLVKHQNKTPAEALQAIQSDEQELSDAMKALLGQ